MDKKLAVTSLIIFIAVIFAFVGTFGWFIVFKERVCAKDINSTQCFEKYPTFLSIELNRI